MIVGVLAFQGDFQEHIDVLTSMHVPSVEVRSVSDLAKVDALIIPGGESTVIAKFLEETGVGKEIVRRVRKVGKVGLVGASLFVYGTCAGAILLAKKATGKNAPWTLGLIDITVDRNAYGTQIDSFETDLKISGTTDLVRASFIRAPKITRVGRNVEVLARQNGDPVLVRQGRVMASTFHTEVRSVSALHRLFLET